MKKSKLILLIIGIVLVITGITYAAFTFAINLGNIKGDMECFKVNYSKGSDIGSDSNSRTLMMGDDYTSGLFASVIVGVDKGCTINGKGTLYLNTDTSTSSALLTSGALKYQVIVNGIVSSGKGTITSTGKTAIYNNISVTTNSSNISVAVWLDSSMINENNMEAILSSNYKGSISMKVESGDK